jgi:hypothetical protein
VQLERHGAGVIWVSRGRRLPLTIALLIGLIVLGVIIGRTHGPKPALGATYTGTVYVETAAGKITQRLPITFAVNGSGRRVSAFRFPGGLPRLCPASRLGTVSAATGTAPVRAPSGFELNLAIDGATPHIGTLEISGVFHSFNRESGAVAAHYGSAGRQGCDASGGYTAKAES